MARKTKYIFAALVTLINLYILSLHRDYYTFDSKTKLIQRLSVLLTDSMRDLGRLSCKFSRKSVSIRGGWCAKISGKKSIHHQTDIDLAYALSNFLEGKRVASFGDGPGEYKRIITRLEKVISYDAYDGAPFAEMTTNHDVKFLDLSVPVYHLYKFDWVVSLEVGEHIPKKYESVYFDNLVRHAREGIILSWSKKGQAGHSHVNNRDFDYIKQQMELRGFMHEPVMSENLKSKATLEWLKENLNVFVKE